MSPSEQNAIVYFVFALMVIVVLLASPAESRERGLHCFVTSYVDGQVFDRTETILWLDDETKLVRTRDGLPAYVSTFTGLEVAFTSNGWSYRLDRHTGVYMAEMDGGGATLLGSCRLSLVDRMPVDSD